MGIIVLVHFLQIKCHTSNYGIPLKVRYRNTVVLQLLHTRMVIFTGSLPVIFVSTIRRWKVWSMDEFSRQPKITRIFISIDQFQCDTFGMCVNIMWLVVSSAKCPNNFVIITSEKERSFKADTQRCFNVHLTLYGR